MPSQLNENVQNIYLEKNIIEIILKGDFVVLTQLRALSLSSNRISHIKERSFSDLISLISLHLYNNRLTLLTLEHFIELANLLGLSLFENVQLTFDPCSFSQLSLKSLEIYNTSTDLTIHSSLRALHVSNSIRRPSLNHRPHFNMY